MLSALNDWLRDGNSIISPKIGITQIPGRGRCVICTQEIAPGSQLLVIRRRQLLNKQTIKVSCPKWTPSWNNLNSHQLLALTISLYRNDPDGYWYPFLSQLPTLEEFRGIPLTITDEEELKRMPSSVQKHVSKQKKVFAEDFEAVKAVISNDPELEISCQLFLESWLCVNSRCLYMKLPGSDGTSADNMTMAPFVDFLNHTPVSLDESVRVDITAIGMVVTARRRYSPGEEILLGYGPHDNSFLLCEYGFTIPKNQWDSLDITEEVLNLLGEWHKGVLRELGYLGDYTVGVDGPSFRTEIAISCIQEKAGSEVRVPHVLRSFCEGINEGSKYRLGIIHTLKKLLITAKENVIQLPQNDITRGYIDIIDAYLMTNE